MKKDITISKESLTKYVHIARRNAAIALFLFLAAIYGFLGMRIAQLLSTEPDQAAISRELQTIGVTKVDEASVRKMEQLKDNSVSVQTLFDNARSNPFQE